MAVDIIDLLLDALDIDEELYVYHEIVHNRHVVERLQERGAIFVDTIAEIPEGSIVVFSAHGVSPTVRKEADDRHLKCIDATCPLVTKVHAEAIRYEKRGWQIILIGHRNHQEVVGTQGEAPNAIQVVELPSDIPSLHIDDPDKLVYLTQTTLSIEDAQIIISALKAAFPTIHAPPSDDICYATTNRQIAVKELCKLVDTVLVIGAPNSSNCNRLREVAEKNGINAYLVNGPEEVTEDQVKGVGTVGIVSGASTPETLVEAVVTMLEPSTIISRTVIDEDVAFVLPTELR